MQFADTTAHELANAWAIVLAASIGAAVFGLVLRWALRIDLSFGVRLDARALLVRLVQLPARALGRLARQRMPAQPAVLAVSPARPDLNWEVVGESLLARWDHLRVVGALHERASTRIDASEYALDRVLADCAAVMMAESPLARLQQTRAAIAGRAPAVAAYIATPTGRDPIPASLAA